jgi:hypothetical protein
MKVSSFLVLFFSIFLFLFCFGCQKEPYAPLLGSWKLSVFGAASGQIPLTISHLPMEEMGVMELQFEGRKEPYNLFIKIEQDGQTKMEILHENRSIGDITGTLDMNGRGLGIYNMSYSSNNSQFTLTGNWLATKK